MIINIGCRTDIPAFYSKWLMNDIGAYNTCGHLCKYCYANDNKNLVVENIRGIILMKQ